MKNYLKFSSCLIVILILFTGCNLTTENSKPRLSLFVGVDIDDNAFHIAGFDPTREEFIELVSKPNSGSLLLKLKKFKAADYTIRVCYEASYIGYNLCRLLSSLWNQYEKKMGGLTHFILSQTLFIKYWGDRIEACSIFDE